MRFHLIVIMFVAGGIGGLASHFFSSSTELSAGHTRKIRQVVHSFIKESKEAPELVARALQTYSLQQEEAHVRETHARMNAERDRLSDSDTAIVMGDPDAQTKLIVFYDNNCPHCRTTDLQLRKVLEKNKDLAVVYRQYPILGKRSEEVAAGIIAVAEHDKFPQVNHAISQSDKPLTLELLIEMAKAEGITPQQLKDGMTSDEVQELLKENRELGEKIGLQSTPTVILVNEKEVKILHDLDEESVTKALAGTEDGSQGAGEDSGQKTEEKSTNT
ncbi:MAG: thioredoxin domain-containing protein [Alphaproteobacteria bacterium]